MRLIRTSLAVAVAAALVAGATASAGSEEATAQRQRVALNIVVNNTTDTATFTLSRLTRRYGPGVRLDEGTVTTGGWSGGDYILNGMMVFGHVVGSSVDGKHGTLGLVQRFDETEMQNGTIVGVGTWKVSNGTGAYSGFKGGGRYVAVALLNGRRTLVRQEGWVTVTG